MSRQHAEAIHAAWPSGPPGYALLAVLVGGVALRVIAVFGWWPVATQISDGYERFAGSNPFENPVHPAGYSLILGALGAVTFHEIAFTIFLQHLSGIVSALLLWAATRRVTRSDWAGLLPAGIVLLQPDQIFLEHAIMSESWAILATSVGLYAAVRAFDEPGPWWRWPLLAGAALGLAVTIRTAGLFVLPVAVVALLLCRPGVLRSWRNWGAPAAAAGAAAAIVLTYAAANATVGERFDIRSSPGWYLYGRAAQFADCDRFDPPEGTEVLCENRPSSERQGGQWYWGLGFRAGSTAPGPRHLGPFGEHDELIGEWSRRAILAQPVDYLGSVWEYLHPYWSGSPPERPSSGSALDPQLAFADGYNESQRAAIEPRVERRLEGFYNDFAVHKNQTALEFLRELQQVIRFAPIALSAATLFTLVGLVFGSRRSRVGVFLFGVGGLALIVAPALTGNYFGRYVIPMAGPLAAAVAITTVQLWRGAIRPRWSVAPEAPETRRRDLPTEVGMRADSSRRRRPPYQVLVVLGAYFIALVIAAAALVAWLSGDDESGNDNGTTVPTQGAGGQGKASQPRLVEPPASRESVKEAKKKITTLLASDECDRINELNPVSRQQFLDTKDRCESLKRLDGLKVRGAEPYGDAGAVIDYASGSRTISAVLIRDRDGLFHVAFIDGLRGVPSADTKLAKQFDGAAERGVKALANRDCDAFLDVAHRRFGRGAGSRDQVCPRVDENPIAKLFEAYPKAKTKRLGGNEAYGFYSVSTPGVHVTAVLARQTEKGAPAEAPPLPKAAAKYGYVDDYVTNLRAEDGK
jgi:4-amino-4-deoxy-L-arabinose transferase-like glycosyltransferase